MRNIFENFGLFFITESAGFLIATNHFWAAMGLSFVGGIYLGAFFKHRHEC